MFYIRSFDCLLACAPSPLPFLQLLRCMRRNETKGNTSRLLITCCPDTGSSISSSQWRTISYVLPSPSIYPSPPPQHARPTPFLSQPPPRYLFLFFPFPSLFPKIDFPLTPPVRLPRTTSQSSQNRHGRLTRLIKRGSGGGGGREGAVREGREGKGAWFCDARFYDVLSPLSFLLPHGIYTLFLLSYGFRFVSVSLSLFPLCYPFGRLLG